MKEYYYSLYQLRMCSSETNRKLIYGDFSGGQFFLTKVLWLQIKTEFLSDGIESFKNPDFFYFATSSSLALASVLMLSSHDPKMAAAAPALISMVKAGVKWRDGTSSVSSFH